MSLDKERTPVIVGVGRMTQFPKPVEECHTPVGMLQEAGRRAALDACGSAAEGEKLLKDLVGIGAPAMFLEMRWRTAFPSGPIATTGGLHGRFRRLPPAESAQSARLAGPAGTTRAMVGVVAPTSATPAGRRKTGRSIATVCSEPGAPSWCRGLTA